MFASILSGFGGASLNQILKVGGGILTVLLIVPALLKLFIVTVDEGWAAIRTRNGKPIVRKREHAVRYARGPKAGRLKHPASPGGELVVLRPGTHGAFPLLLWYRMVDVRTRAADLPARHLTTGTGHTYLVQASIEWRPEVTGKALRVFELEVRGVHERVSNVVGAALRDVIRDLGAPPLPSNADMSDLVLAECRQQVLEACGVELIRVTLTGDALTEGYMLAEAIRTREPGDVVVPLSR